jgi:PPE-repeat protein
MYTGPGSGSLLAAAGSWDSLSAELDITAATYASVISVLTGLYWQGPASAAMSATAAPYVGWLYTTAEQTRQTAMQARAAAAAYELAYAMTVHPAAVTANRTQLATLIATNFFGQNTPAIAATEAQYAVYWAQDATAMYGYAASAAVAAQLPLFPTPQQTTTPDGLTAQNDAVSKANLSATPTVSQAVSAAPTEEEADTVPADDTTLFDVAVATFAGTESTANMEEFAHDIVGDEFNFGLLSGTGAAAEPQFDSALTAAPPLTGSASSLGGGVSLGNVTATLARADTVGTMSVPASWAAPSSGPITALPASGLPTLPGTDELASSGSGTPGIPGMPAGTVSRATGVIPRYGARLTVMARPPAAG